MYAPSPPGGGAHTSPDALAEIFSDPMLGDLGVPRYELVEIANNAPAVADAIARLYTAVKEAGRNPEMGGESDARSLVTPENWVRDYIQQHRNHYPELEDAAETLGGALSDPLSMAEPMRRRLKDAWGISASVVPQSGAGQCQPALRSRPPRFPDVLAIAGRKPHLRARLPAIPGRVRERDRPAGRGSARRPTRESASSCT